MKPIFFSMLLVVHFSVSAQVVEKIPTKFLNGPDGMVIDKKGNIYIANWGTQGDGSTVVKIAPNGNEEIYLDSLAAPDGLTFDDKGNLIVSCFGSGEIIQFDKHKNRKVLASGLDHPSDLKYDKRGILYVSSFGMFNGQKIYTIDKKEQVSVFADSLRVPLGLAFNSRGELFASTFGEGVIYRFNGPRKKHRVAQPSAEPGVYLQYLAFDPQGNLYCPSFGKNKIYKISTNGTVTALILKDKNGAEVTLNGPNSIFYFNGNLYFTEFTTNSAYRILLD